MVIKKPLVQIPASTKKKTIKIINGSFSVQVTVNKFNLRSISKNKFVINF